MEGFVLRSTALTARRFMDKGMLRFMAEAYLLLHSGSVVHAELTPQSAAASCAKTDKPPQTAQCRAASGGETSNQQAPEQERLLKG